MLLGTEGAFRISIDCYDGMWSGHLELEVIVVRYRIESSKRGSSKQCVIAAAEGDDVEDQAFASEVVRRTENDFQCDGARGVSFYAGYCSLEGSCGGLDS